MNPAILGRQPTLTLLQDWLYRKALPQSLLLHGPEGVGKRLVALRLVAHCLCLDEVARSSEILGACGRCSSCVQLQQGQHPDVQILQPQPAASSSESSSKKSSKGKSNWSIRIDAMHQFMQRFKFYALNEQYQFGIIDEAHQMNRESANALLKLLEEPRPGLVLILVSSQPHSLLPTIRSRVVSVPMGRLSFEDMAAVAAMQGQQELLARWSASQLEFVADVFDGSIPRWLEFLSDERRLLGLEKFLRKETRVSEIFVWAKEQAALDYDPALLVAVLQKLLVRRGVAEMAGLRSTELDDGFAEAYLRLKAAVPVDFVLENLFFKLRA